MVTATATEMQNRFGHYLEMAGDGTIVNVTKRGVVVARLVPVQGSDPTITRSLVGILPSDMSLDDAREERLSRQ